jgi:hypothetical protein
MANANIVSLPRDASGSVLQPWEPGLFRNVQLALLLRRFTAKYFAQLDVEYESLCPDSYKSRYSKEVTSLRECNAVLPSWKLNHRLEYLLVGGLPAPILRQRAVVHRARLLALVGPEGSEAFGNAFPAPSADAKAPAAPGATDAPDATEALRTESLGALLEIQRLRHVRSEFERLRNRLIAVSMIPGFVFVWLALNSAQYFWSMPAAKVAAILGFLGGYLSVLLRIGSLRWALRYAANYQQVDRLFWNVFLNFYLSLLEGSLGAIVLYIAFSAGLVSVTLFPSIPPDGHKILMANVLSHQDLARLMLWSVVAGFSERAVPDFLSGLGKDLVRKTDTPATQATTPTTAG